MGMSYASKMARLGGDSSKMGKDTTISISSKSLQAKNTRLNNDTAISTSIAS